MGASHLADRENGRLSGGEQQRVAIASVLAMGQRLLLLDEPTSQLDPVAAEELLALVTRINRDRGVTVVVAEHRTSRIFAEADRVVVMEAGRIGFDGTPAEAARHLAAGAAWLLPPVTQAFAAARREQLPLTVRDARRLGPPQPEPLPQPVGGRAVAMLTGVGQRYGELEALRGATTGFTGAAGDRPARRERRRQVDAGTDRSGAGGTVDGAGRAATGCAATSARTRPTTRCARRVDDEVAYALENLGVDPAQRRRRVRDELERFGLDSLAGRHPRDLSSGERQRLAIASVTVMRPSLLLLDEPTRGMDGLRKLALAELVRGLAADGCAVAVITHDLDFAAEAAALVTTMARGRVLADRAARGAAGRRRLLLVPAGDGARLRDAGRRGRAAPPRPRGGACLASCW